MKRYATAWLALAIGLSAGACDTEQLRAASDPNIVNKGERPSDEDFAQVEPEPDEADEPGASGSSEAVSDEAAGQEPGQP